MCRGFWPAPMVDGQMWLMLKIRVAGRRSDARAASCSAAYGERRPNSSRALRAWDF